MKKRAIVLTIIAASFGVSGCGPSAEGNSDNSVESYAQKAVLASLKDPDSAKFGEFTLVNDNAACLTVNARNSLGGYTGDQQAYLIKKNNLWNVLTIQGGLSHQKCIEIMASS